MGIGLDGKTLLSFDFNAHAKDFCHHQEPQSGKQSAEIYRLGAKGDLGNN